MATRLVLQGIARRRAIMKFVASYITEHSYPPSLREIGKGVGVSHNAVRWHLVRLVDEGKIQMSAGGHRTIIILDWTGYGSP